MPLDKFLYIQWAYCPSTQCQGGQGRVAPLRATPSTPVWPGLTQETWGQARGTPAVEPASCQEPRVWVEPRVSSIWDKVTLVSTMLMTRTGTRSRTPRRQHCPETPVEEEASGESETTIKHFQIFSKQFLVNFINDSIYFFSLTIH